MNRTLMLVLVTMLFSAEVFSAECVVLLHGLARTSRSMSELEEKLTQESFYVVNVDYLSRSKQILALSEIAVGDGLAQCRAANASPVNYVTHSLGGILVRQFYKNHAPVNVSRVVMLGPPNNGSEVVDYLKNIPGYEWFNGPAGMQLGTADADVPKRLGPVNFELGVIAGTQSVNLILSTFLPNPDDGKVSVESAKVEGMCGFITLPATHPFLMTNDDVVTEVISFLKQGVFTTKPTLCG
jgi:pimeloyl-ACP methyl ester carboxylesterase